MGAENLFPLLFVLLLFRLRIAHLLEQIPYEDVPKQDIELPDRVRHADYIRAPVPPELYVPERY